MSNLTTAESARAWQEAIARGVLRELHGVDGDAAATAIAQMIAQQESSPHHELVYECMTLIRR